MELATSKTFGFDQNMSRKWWACSQITKCLHIEHADLQKDTQNTIHDTQGDVSYNIYVTTVDGGNPAPPGMVLKTL